MSTAGTILWLTPKSIGRQIVSPPVAPGFLALSKSVSSPTLP